MCIAAIAIPTVITRHMAEDMAKATIAASVPAGATVPTQATVPGRHSTSSRITDHGKAKADHRRASRHSRHPHPEAAEQIAPLITPLAHRTIAGASRFRASAAIINSTQYETGGRQPNHFVSLQVTGH
jgi:hypothetical protein